MPTYLQLMQSSPGSLGEVATALTGADEQLNAIAETFDKTARSTDATWKGKAKDAHDGGVDRLQTGIRQMGDGMKQTAQLVRQASQTLTTLVNQLRQTESAAKGAGFLVIPGAMAIVMPGQMHYQQAAAAGPGAPAVIAAYQAVAQAYTMILGTIVGMATAADTGFAASITGLGAGLAGSAAGLVRPPVPDPRFSPDLQPGEVRLDGLMEFADGESRGTGGEAYITPDMLREGEKPGVPRSIRPAGYLGLRGPHAKSHVIADVLGGPLDDPANYATLYSRNFSRVNDGPMAQLERRAAEVIRGDVPGVPGQNVRYRVDMVGNDKLPDGVRIHLLGDRGYRETIYLPNM
jgi:uncharacterized protein YukE